jgi:hypothetical protein
MRSSDSIKASEFISKYLVMITQSGPKEELEEE